MGDRSQKGRAGLPSSARMPAAIPAGNGSTRSWPGLVAQPAGLALRSRDAMHSGVVVAQAGTRECPLEAGSAIPGGYAW